MAERLVSEDNQRNAPSDFPEAALREEGHSFSRERKSGADIPWKRQTVFMEEEEDEFWSSHRSKEKSTSHLLYQVGDKDDEAFQKEASFSHKEEPSLVGVGQCFAWHV